MIDDFGDRMKVYEAKYTDLRIQEPYVYVRLDGRGFSKFTKNMKKPFDNEMTRVMQLTTQYLVERTHAMLGYVQSDEISLAFRLDTVMFEGKIQKLASVLSGMASEFFSSKVQENEYLSGLFGNKNPHPHFDCRVIGVPTAPELSNMFLWRCKDATRNSVSMVAQSLFSHQSLQGVNTKWMLELIAAKKGPLFYENYPWEQRVGTFYQRKTTQRLLTETERSRIPEKHQLPADHLVERSSIVQVLKNKIPIYFEVFNTIFPVPVLSTQ